MSPAWVMAACLLTQGAEPSGPLLVDLTTLPHRAGTVTTPKGAQVPTGTAELVDGQFGEACKFTFVESAGPQFFTASVRPAENWDDYDGFSFWIRGDGSKSFGGLEFIDGDDYGLRYAYCFPIDSREWRKITVRFSDLVPELAGPPVDSARAKTGFAPRRFRNVWFGKWFYWRDFPACSYTVERMTLEKSIPPDPPVATPSGAPLARTLARPLARPLARTLAKLKAKEPITLVTMGDSLSDKRHWANREILWSELLAARLQSQYGSRVRLVNPALGGTTLSQNIVLVPRWVSEAPSPDLVVIWFGGNDWDNGVRGSRFKQYLRMAVDRVRRATGGRSDILLMTTCPAFQRWETMNELCQAVYAVAQEKQTGFADPAGDFLKAGTREEALKRKYWVWDNVHLGPGGHALAAEAVLRAIQSEGRADLAAAPQAPWNKTPAWDLPEGETPLSSFEPGQEGIVQANAGRIVAEHATQGRFALRLESHKTDYVNVSLEDNRTLGPLHAHARFLADVFNPQSHDVALQVLVKDPLSKDYYSRHNGTRVIKPGRSTIDLDYTKLPRTAREKKDPPEVLDAKQITLFVLFLEPYGDKKSVTLFFDSLRLAKSSE